MSESNDHHPDSGRIEPVLEGDAQLVFTPCHGHRVLLPVGQAVPGAKLEVICPEGGEAWLVDLVTDDQAKSGLRALWTDPEEQVEGPPQRAGQDTGREER